MDIAIADLINKLSEATQPDRELDVLIWALAEGHMLEWQGTTLVVGYEGAIGWIDPGVHSRNFRTNRAATGPGAIPTYTTSVDAALALIQKWLPGWYWGAGPGTATLLDEKMPGMFRVDAKGATAPLALCIALLRSLQAQKTAALKPEGGETP